MSMIAINKYPEYLKERDYYDSILGPPLEQWEYGDNDPSDPDNNWEEDDD